MYLVKWKNYPMDQCTWEPYRNLTNCTEILETYNANKIVFTDIYSSDSYKKLYESLLTFTEQEMIEILHNIIKNGMTSIDMGIVKGTIGYLSTLSSSFRSPELMDVARHNLKLNEVNRRRQKQLEKLEKWQTDMNKVCGFNLTVINVVDFEGPPKKFVYVDQCVAGEGVTIHDDPPIW